jgi:hypothetical protein
MKSFPFVWTELTPLVEELKKPIVHISVQFFKKRPMFVTLWRPDGTGIKIQSEMFDVAERIEVGVLRFSYAPFEHSAAESFAKIAPAFGSGSAVSKLVIVESATSVESGVIFSANDGNEIMIVANVWPCHLAVCGVQSITNDFEPEYPIDMYSRVLVT